MLLEKIVTLTEKSEKAMILETPHKLWCSQRKTRLCFFFFVSFFAPLRWVFYVCFFLLLILDYEYVCVEEDER
jgi:hypothetical protein